MSYRDWESTQAAPVSHVRSGCVLLAVLMAILGVALFFLFSVVLAPPKVRVHSPARVLQDTDDDDLMPGDEIAAPDESRCGLKILDRLPQKPWNPTPTRSP